MQLPLVAYFNVYTTGTNLMMVVSWIVQRKNKTSRNQAIIHL